MTLVVRMPPRLKESLFCLACGASLVGGLFATGELLGVEYGLCEPASLGASLQSLAVMPGAVVLGRISELFDMPLNNAVMIATAVAMYTIATLVVRLITRSKKAPEPARDQGSSSTPLL